MKNNIFENAKFGDKFKTRDGQVAIYIAKKETRSIYNDKIEIIEHTYALENRCTVHWCDNEGINHSFVEDFDIVGKWEESIDEEKLDGLSTPPREWKDWEFPYKAGFKAGYRKAKEK